MKVNTKWDTDRAALSGSAISCLRRISFVRYKQTSGPAQVRASDDQRGVHRAAPLLILTSVECAIVCIAPMKMRVPMNARMSSPNKETAASPLEQIISIMQTSHYRDSRIAAHEALRACVWVIAELKRTALLLASRRGQGQVSTAQRSLTRHTRRAERSRSCEPHWSSFLTDIATFCLPCVAYAMFGQRSLTFTKYRIALFIYCAGL